MPSARRRRSRIGAQGYIQPTFCASTKEIREILRYYNAHALLARARREPVSVSHSSVCGDLCRAAEPQERSVEPRTSGVRIRPRRKRSGLLLTRTSTCGRRSRHSTSTRCVPSTEPSTTGYSFSSVELISTKPSTNVSEPFMHMSHVSGRFDEPRDPTACGVCVVVLSSVSLYRVCAGGV